MIVRPLMNSRNIQGMTRRAFKGASANSFHTNKPQAAEIIVAPCPSAYEIAGPTRLLVEATKLNTAPVHQITPPKPAHRCQLTGAVV